MRLPLRRCPSGKVRYRDLLGAEIALASTYRKGKAKRNEFRAYRCPVCCGWHLTSRSLADAPARERRTA